MIELNRFGGATNGYPFAPLLHLGVRRGGGLCRWQVWQRQGSPYGWLRHCPEAGMQAD
jgi:hypothetical protein